MAIQISIREAFDWFCGKAKEFALSPIPDAERVQIVIDRMKRDVDEKRKEWKDALTAVVAIEDPGAPAEGRLPRARAAFEKLEAQGAAWGTEFQNPATDSDRKKQLEGMLDALDTECNRLESEVAGLEQQRGIRQETLTLRERSYKQARAELKKLETLAPAIVAQTDALQDAQRDRMEALKASADRGEDTGAILQGLQSALDQAQASNTATLMIEDEETEVDIYAVMAKEESAAASSDRVKRWTGQST